MNASWLRYASCYIRTITELNMNWKEFPLLPTYEVSTTGLVRRKGAKAPLKTHVINSGYETLVLSSEGKKSRFRLVHRVVALTFIPNPEGLQQVNHKNGNKLDNRVENLEWCSPKGNMAHARGAGLVTYNNPTQGKKLPPRGGKGGSSFYGVCRPSTKKYFLVRVQAGGKVVFQKCFQDELEAARYYDAKILEHGLDRPLNFPVS